MKGNVRWWTLGLLAFFATSGCSNQPVELAKPVVVTPMARVQVGDGRYLVGTQTIDGRVPMRPGHYQTNGLGDWVTYPNAGQCTWSLWWGNKQMFAGAGFADGVTDVTVMPGQQFEVRGGCTWIEQPA